MNSRSTYKEAATLRHQAPTITPKVDLLVVM